jgi:thymidylate kinase
MPDRPRTFTVALIGPDGAGKTTVARAVADRIPLPTTYLYMGDNPEAVTHSLPTTRLAAALKRRMGRMPDKGPPDWRPAARKPRSRNPLKRALRGTKSLLRTGNQIAEEYYRWFLSWRARRAGRIVLFDRHFFTDYYAWDVIGGRGERTLARRLHGAVLSRTYPKPDLVIYLDAPAELLLARKGEGTLETLERRRGDYLQLAPLLPAFVTVDAARPLDEVVAAVSGLIERYAAGGRAAVMSG